MVKESGKKFHYFLAGRSGDPLPTDPRRQLPGHQGAPPRGVRQGGGHDEGQDGRGDQEDIQHQERLGGPTMNDNLRLAKYICTVYSLARINHITRTNSPSIILYRLLANIS